MHNTLSDITIDDLKEIIEETVEKKFYEILNDDDLGLKLKETVKQRLRYQEEMILQGSKGRNFDEVLNEIGI